MADPPVGGPRGTEPPALDTHLSSLPKAPVHIFSAALSWGLLLTAVEAVPPTVTPTQDVLSCDRSACWHQQAPSPAAEGGRDSAELSFPTTRQQAWPPRGLDFQDSRTIHGPGNDPPDPARVCPNLALVMQATALGQSCPPKPRILICKMGVTPARLTALGETEGPGLSRGFTPIKCGQLS